MEPVAHELARHAVVDLAVRIDRHPFEHARAREHERLERRREVPVRRRRVQRRRRVVPRIEQPGIGDVIVAHAEVDRGAAHRRRADRVAHRHARAHHDARLEQHVIVVVVEGARHLHVHLGVAAGLRHEDERHHAAPRRAHRARRAVVELLVAAERVDEAQVDVVRRQHVPRRREVAERRGVDERRRVERAHGQHARPRLHEAERVVRVLRTGVRAIAARDREQGREQEGAQDKETTGHHAWGIGRSRRGNSPWAVPRPLPARWRRAPWSDHHLRHAGRVSPISRRSPPGPPPATPPSACRGARGIPRTPAARAARRSRGSPRRTPRGP